MVCNAVQTRKIRRQGKSLCTVHERIQYKSSPLLTYRCTIEIKISPKTKNQFLWKFMKPSSLTVNDG